ncbi:MAG: hypothetical protein JW774_01960 [Candidatus Aureabacteria bacterium]|nr:hypothetical protein [Candidatus Auribacterota bacterium]
MNMKGYDNESRVKWQKALGEMKNQIDCVWIISTSSLFKIGPSVMTLLTNIKLKVISSETQIIY